MFLVFKMREIATRLYADERDPENKGKLLQ